MLNSDVDVMDGAAAGTKPPGGNYQRQVVVDPKTGGVSAVPVISDAARAQSGGLLKQDPDELRRQKEERITEAKRIRRERRRLEKQKQDELDQIEGTHKKRISSEEYFSSKNDMIQQTKHNIVADPSDTSPSQ